jgi:hypothetical protein
VFTGCDGHRWSLGLGLRHYRVLVCCCLHLHCGMMGLGAVHDDGTLFYETWVGMGMKHGNGAWEWSMGMEHGNGAWEWSIRMG